VSVSQVEMAVEFSCPATVLHIIKRVLEMQKKL
jgi:hypothetical protein